MAENTSTDSASKRKKNQSISAIRELAKRESERAKLNYEKGKDALKLLRGESSYSPPKISTYSKDKIRGYLQNVSSSEINLRNAMHYMYYRSQILFRIINWYASIWDLRCRKVVPRYDLIKDNPSDKMMKSLNDTLDMLDLYKVHENMYAPLLRCYLDDIVYFLWYTDDCGSFPYILNPDWCRICGEYSYGGDLAFEVDMSKFQGKHWQEVIESLGSPLKEMYAEYKRTNKSWIRVPDNYAGCFKFRREDLDHIVSPFVPLLQQVAGLSDLEDIQAIADEQSILKLIVYKIKTLSGAKSSDDWEITPDLALDYFERAKKDGLPDYVSAIPILGDGLDIIDFSKSSADTQVDRLKNAQSNVMNMSGGGAVLSANNITSTAAFNAWMKSESEFAISSLMPQITGFVNRMLSYDVSNPCNVDFFEVTVLTKDDFRKSLLELNQYSFNSRLALGTLYGFSEKDTLATLYVETELLKLQDKMIYPLQSSFTASGTGEVGQVGEGAPEKDAGELSPEGDRDRNR